MEEKFYTILTNMGKAKIANSSALGSKVNFSKIKAGDGNGKYHEPTEDQIKLVNTVWEGNIRNIEVTKENPNWIEIEAIIPSDEGGFTIREFGVFDEEDNLLAISKCPETYKPIICDGSIKELLIKMVLSVSNTDNVSLKIDPTIVVAKKSDVDKVSVCVDEIKSQMKDCAKKSDLDTINNNLAQLSKPNLLINGDFQVWQRGEKFENISANTYTADRWNVATPDGNMSGIIISKNVGLKIQNPNKKHLFIRYYFEDNMYVDKVFKKPLTLSVKLYNDEKIYNLTWNFNRSDITNGDNKQFDKIALILEYEKPKNRLVLQIPTSETDIEIEYVKLELGSIATPCIPRHYAEELALCQRYYEVIPRLADIANPNMDILRAVGYYKVTKRVDATITYFWNNEINKVGCVRTSDNQTISVTPKAFYIGGVENIIVDGALGFVGYLQWETRIVADAEIY